MNADPNSKFSAEDELAKQIHVEPQEAYEMETEPEGLEEQPYDGWEGCWPGDGSGMDDFEDFNQNEAYDYMDE